MGGWFMMKFIEDICRKNGVDVEKVKNYGLKSPMTITSRVQLAQT
jgi:hypothetical protein